MVEELELEEGGADVARGERAATVRRVQVRAVLDQPTRHASKLRTLPVAGQPAVGDVRDHGV